MSICISRKNFLIGSMSVAALGARQMFAATPGSIVGKPNMKLGVLSDTHVNCKAAQDYLKDAFIWFRDNGADAVLIAGDMADSPNVAQLQLVADAWFDVFPNGKAPDGRKVEQLFIYGNHDAGLAQKPENWQNAFHEEYKPIYMKEVKGYQFIGTHWPAHGQRNQWFEENSKKLKTALPFFYFQHQHPKDTCYGPWAWGHDDGTATRLLSPFANAIAFSGHSHYTLTDEKSVWQGAFTSIGTSSLSYSSFDYNYRENMGGNNYGRQEVRKRQMGRINTGDGKQGMLLSICDDHIRIERHEFVWKQSLGDDWILPIGKGAAKPFEYAKRKPVRKAPEFGKDAKVKVAFVEQKMKEGETKPPKPTHLDVTVSHAETVDKCRVFEYEIQAILHADDVDMVATTRRVMARGYYYPPSKAKADTVCRFALDELPKNVDLTFKVTPIECFGTRGKAIESENFKV